MFRKIFTLTIIMLLCTVAFARVTDDIRDRVGSYTGPINGTEQDDNVKASLDLLHGLIGAQLTKGTGEIIYCDSGASGGGTGADWTNACVTLDAAVGKCTADRGDWIIVAAGHAENLSGANGVDADKAGITIIGLGNGQNMPVISFTNAAGEFVIGADDVKVYNLVFLAHVTDVAHAIDVETGNTNFVIENCDFIVDTEATDEFTDAIEIAADSDYGIITKCGFYAGGGGADTAISYVGADYIRIIDNDIHGDYAQAGIENVTTVALASTIEDNIIYNGDLTIGLNTEPCIEIKSDTTGVIRNNVCSCDVANPELAIVAADCHVFGNIYNETEGSSGEQDLGLKVGHVYTRTMSSVVTAATDQMFSVAGGRIEIISLFGECTTAMASNPGDMTIQLDATAGADYDRHFCTTVTIDALGAGDVVRFTNAIDEGVLDLTANVGAGQTLSWFCSPGEIEQTITSTGTGAVKWYMSFRPLEPGVTVTEN